MYKLFLFLGSVLGFLAVALGAFGAHALRSRMEADLMAVYQTGVQYHMYHALALLLTAVLCRFFPQSPLFMWAGWLFFAGVVVFSGSLYVLSMTGVRAWGAVTPVGGLAFLAGWLLLMIAAFTAKEGFVDKM